ncbi:MAG: 3',5'-cyclic adenosine monophosphate phosphodiesterase CpdA [Candidatus Micrarchaeota archaeon]|nr:MAG: 3',5'-cyclic adenosine monophosphate phosphodiesterase CpdA [Candidatus Micrarchaeota archaeon]
MILDNDIEILDGLEIAYIRTLDYIVATDLHLGYEDVMGSSGILIPKASLKMIKDKIQRAYDRFKPKGIIVTGDIKNEFSEVSLGEFNELYEFIRFLKDLSLDMIFIKGNHDNFIDRYKDAFKFKSYDQYVKIDRYLFTHGDVDLDISDIDTIIMGHEHPAVTIYTKVGAKRKYKCFLYGRCNKHRILVLPALGYYSTGTDLNIIPKSQILSPLLRRCNIDKLHAILIDGNESLDFGELGRLRYI